MTHWLEDAVALPTRDGQDMGGAQERTMLAFAQDVGGIRTIEEINLDGSITRLRTRQGRPTFETEGAVAVPPSATQLRGFVAKVPGSRAVLFNPYTMEILKTPYTPAAKLYEVQDFLTESTWYDVVLFDGTTIKANAKAMPRLKITANHGYEAIPHVINYTVGDQYGNAERNTTEKRVFAVGRYSVTSWGGGGVTETLTPTEPRTESRALTIGQRIDGDTAYLGELYHGADGWDGATEWYFRTAAVQMLLTAAYLVKTSVGANVAMSPPSLASAGSSSGTMSVPTTLPATEVALVGHGRATATTAYTSNVIPPGGGGNNGTYACVYDFDGTASRALAGTVPSTYTRTQYSGAASSSEAVSGITLAYLASNVKRWDSRDEHTEIISQSVVLFEMDDSGASNNTVGKMTGDASNLYWGEYFVDPPTGGLNAGGPGPNRGTATKAVDGEIISSSYVTRAYEEQDGSFSVSAGGTVLVEGTYFRHKSSGNKAIFTPRVSTTYATYLSQPPSDFYNTVSGVGIYNGPVILSAYADPSTSEVWIRRYQGVWHGFPYDQYTQDASAVADINAKYEGVRSKYAAQTLYENENTSGYTTRTGDPYYTASVSSVSLDNNSLTWTTKDFILYDPTNEVYITVEGNFVGTDNVATLTVLLKVQTRHHTTTKTLGTFNYTYTEMLVEREIGSTGKYAVPSPQIRAIFAPLYQEQGSFKGDYVTKAEETAGIVAFHGFNFILNLRMYSDFDTCNDDNDGQQVYFVPCNLMEMLYAFVFSTEYGVAEGGTRYPVTYTSRFNEMRDTLFATPVRVSVKNGSATNWTDSLGGDFAAVGTVALYRT